MTGYGTLKLEFAIGQVPLTDTPLTWTDYSTYLQRVTIDRGGRKSILEMFDPGTMTVGLSWNGYDPDLIAYTPVRLSVEDSGANRINLFTGVISPQSMDYHVLGRPHSARTVTTSIQCVDSLGVLATRPLPTLETAANGGMSGTALTLVAFFYGPLWPVDWGSTLDAGQSIVDNSLLGGTALDYFQLVTVSEGGSLYCDRDGKVTFDDRYAPITKSRLNSMQVDLGPGNDASYAIEYTFSTPNRIYTEATVQRPEGLPQTFTTTETTFLDLYGIVSYPKVDTLLANDAECMSRAEGYVNFQTLMQHEVRLYPLRDSDTLDAAVQRELRDYVKIDDLFSNVPTWCEGIHHDIDCARRAWTVDLTLNEQAVSPLTDIFPLDGTGILDGTKLLGF